tara:strand:- start:2904 stop:3065 length:162 start_codon:yes stop_codon:yes gene_type:complete
MQTYQVEYTVIGDNRWHLIDADDFEDAAWIAKNWTTSNGYELVNVKPLQVEET